VTKEEGGDDHEQSNTADCFDPWRGCGSGISSGESAEIPRELRVGMSNQLPYAFLDDKGALTGQSPDVLRAALAGSVDKIDGVLADFGALIPGLLAKRFDVICTGLFVRPKRCELLAYGNPDSLSRESLVVKRGNPLKLHSLDDIKSQPNVRVAILRGGVEEGYLKSYGIPEAQWVVLPDIVPTFAAIKSNRAEVAFNSLVIILPTLKSMNDPDLELVEDFADPVVNGKPAIDYAAMGFRKEDSSLRTTYNAGLAKLVASGELAKINAKYGLPASLTPNASTPQVEELCKA
jgi:polar amino acid transport system substrate-binding protein